MFYYLYKLLFVLYFIFVIVYVYFVSSFPKKGTPLDEIDTLSVLRLTGLVHIVYTILSLSLLLLLCLWCYIQQVFAALLLYNELHVVIYIYIGASERYFVWGGLFIYILYSISYYVLLI